ncbi:MAG: sensor histidine kinase, partial [Desulfomonilaceae bacterium]
IPEQYLQKIMQQFFRVPGQSGATGIGLGLSIVQEIVAAHGGTISVESVEGRGSKFSFSLIRSKEYPGLGVKPWTI